MGWLQKGKSNNIVSELDFKGKLRLLDIEGVKILDFE